jgi:NTP pyrophosphatase (non-canonical NTP hydrolase)
MKTLREYQTAAWLTALPSTKNVNYMAMGLGNEAGEVLGKVKKIIRGDSSWSTQDISKEIGDVLWYCAGLASVLNLTLEGIARENINKLSDRKERGVIQGNGDTR